ncbi:hypothetical protein [Pectobacterium sp. B1J-3]
MRQSRWDRCRLGGIARHCLGKYPYFCDERGIISGALNGHNMAGKE